MKTCPCPCGCSAHADDLEEKERIFGYRGRIIQSYCKKCRVPHAGIQPAENINPIFNTILEGIKKDKIKTSKFYSQIPKFNENGKFITGSMKQKLTKEFLINQNKILVKEFLELLERHEPQIEDIHFFNLFEMYNFQIKKPEQESFFDFEIYAKSEKCDQIESNKNQSIFVILKIYQTISEAYMKVLTAKLKDFHAIIISFVNDNPPDFIIKNEKICLLNRELIKCLLLYRIDKKRIDEIYAQLAKYENNKNF